MNQTENFGTFFKENKKLVKDYIDIRLEIFRIKLVRFSSKSAGYLIWLILSMFLFFLFMIFVGLVIGFWLSEITGRYTTGFGLTTLIMLVVILLMAVFRKALFVNPIIRAIINRSADDNDRDKMEN